MKGYCKDYQKGYHERATIRISRRATIRGLLEWYMGYHFWGAIRSHRGFVRLLGLGFWVFWGFKGLGFRGCGFEGFGVEDSRFKVAGCRVESLLEVRCWVLVAWDLGWKSWGFRALACKFGS